MFNIGDKVWIAKVCNSEKWVTCPDCFGGKTLKVILGDGTELTIPCVGCAPGLEFPRGVIRQYEWGPSVEPSTITGMEITLKNTEYHFSCWRIDAENVFATKEEAESRAAELAQTKAQEDAIAFQKKDKPTRDWAWHVHYHRRQIRDAEKTIAYAQAKLGIALTHSNGRRKSDNA